MRAGLTNTDTPLGPQVRAIREVIRSTEHQLEELKFQFSDFGNRPSLVVEVRTRLPVCTVHVCHVQGRR